MKDSLYAHPLGEVSKFTFDERVAAVFPDMIQRSVPGYSTIINMTGILAGHFAKPNSKCYDLGCSLGASSLAIANNIEESNCSIIAVDASEAMLEAAQNTVQNELIEWRCEDIRETAITDASVVVLNFTLQFVPQQDRAKLLRNIIQGMQRGGVLILSEKVFFPEPSLQALNEKLHREFKLANGYSDLEVAQKRESLDEVLIPETLDAHKARLREVGFSATDVWFQCFNFASIVAIK